jgi:hypothetical protein
MSRNFAVFAPALLRDQAEDLECYLSLGPRRLAIAKEREEGMMKTVDEGRAF